MSNDGYNAADTPSNPESIEASEEELEQRGEQEIKKADEILEQILDQDRMSEQLDEEMLNDLKDAMNSFEDVKQRAERIEGLIADADNPNEAAKVLSEDDRDLAQIEKDIERAKNNLRDFMQDLGKKEKIVAEEEEEESSLEDLSNALNEHLKEIMELHETLMAEMQSQ